MPNAAARMPATEIVDSLRSNGLLGRVEDASFEPLTGGVSSDIWKIRSKGRTYCVKRALPKLKVQADWFAPVERNRFEVAWYELANKYVPGSAPQILAHDDRNMLCVMEFLPPEEHRLWKSELRDGRGTGETPGMVGDILGRIHAHAAKDPIIHERFPTNDIFHAIRLEPYLEATALKHPDLEEQLFGLSARTAATRLTMIHGDVSPKNILVGPTGPIILDAECACIGDPAFDLAFCLNHLLLKCLWTRSAADAYLVGFQSMVERYLRHVDWEDPAETEARVASLLPGLFLARIDGKSPVEYITAENDKDKVRACARALLFRPTRVVSDVSDLWRKELLR